MARFKHHAHVRKLCVAGALYGFWLGAFLVVCNAAWAQDALTPAALPATTEEMLLTLLRIGGAPAVMGWVGYRLAAAVSSWTPRVVVELPATVKVIVVDEQGERIQSAAEIMKQVQG